MLGRVLAILLTALLLSSVFSFYSSAQSTDPEQPSPQNNILYFWGTQDLTDCWENFDSDGSTGSAEEGYGEEIDGGDAERLEVDITCKMKYNFEGNVYLNQGMKITMEFGVRIDHAEAEDEQDQDLTISLLKGDDIIDSTSFPNLRNDENMQLSWDITVGENATWWNSSDGEPRVRFQISKVGWDASGTPCSGMFQLLKCGGSFRVYFSDNQDGMRSQIKFPIAETPETVVEIESEDKGLPGFGLAAGLGALAMAAIASSRREE